MMRLCNILEELYFDIEKSFKLLTKNKNVKLENVIISIPPSYEGKKVRISYYVKVRTDKALRRAEYTSSIVTALVTGLTNFEKTTKKLEKNIIKIAHDIDLSEFIRVLENELNKD